MKGPLAPDGEASIARICPQVRWRAYQIKESLRAIFFGDLNTDGVTELIGYKYTRASRSQNCSFTRLQETIHTHKDEIMASIELDLSNR